MSFRTPIQIDKPSYIITHEDSIFLLGSCFVENISSKLDRLKFKTCINPFGINYNPISISNSLMYSIEKMEYTKADLFEYNGLWHSFDHHGAFSGVKPEDVLVHINEQIATAHSFLKSANTVMITLGTAHVFEYLSSQKIVSNCHKVPNTEFQRKRLSTKEIINTLSSTLNLLVKFNPNVKIVLTVSPIRHIRDGLKENQRSKAALILACDMLEQQLDQVSYFPSYEILMDDLRDYRFYAADMIHPNDTAIQYIWEQFGNTFFNDETKGLNNEIEKIVLGLNHRFLYPDSEASEVFRQKLQKRILELMERFPFFDFPKA